MKRFSHLLILLCFWQLAQSSSLPAQEPAKKEYSGKPLQFWIDELKSTEGLSREESLRVLEKIGLPAKETAELVKPFLKDEKLDTRFQAILTLWSVQGSGKEVVAVLKETYPKLSIPQRNRLGKFLNAITEIDEPLLEIYLLIAANPQDGYGYSLSNQIVRMGEKAIPLFAKILEAAPAESRGTLIGRVPFQITQMKSGALLAGYLSDAEPFTRLNAAFYLLYIPEKKEAAIEVLLELCKAPETKAGVDALRVLAQQKPVVKKAEEYFAAGLKQKDLELRLALVVPYMELRPEKIEDVLPILEEALKNYSMKTHNQLFEIFRTLGPKTVKLVPTLLEGMRKSTNPTEANMLASALMPHADKLGKEIAEMLFEEPPGKNRQQAMLLVSNAAPALVDPVIKKIQGDNLSHRQLAFRIAGMFPPPSAAKVVPTLAELLKKDDPALINTSLNILELYGAVAQPAIPEILALLDRPNGATFLKAVQKTIDGIRPKSKDLEPLLKKLLAKDPLSPPERFFAVKLMTMTPGRGVEAAKLLEPLLKEKSPAISSFEVQEILLRLGADARGIFPAVREYGRGSLEFLCKMSILVGPEAKVVLPDLLERLKTTQYTPDLLHIGKVIYVLAPDQRTVVDEKLTKVFSEHLDKYPNGSEVNWFLFSLGDLCRLSPGPTKALEPLLLKIFRLKLNEEFQPTAGEVLVRLEPKHEAEVIKAFERGLGEFPSNSTTALTGLLKVKPDHPKALSELKRYLTSSDQRHRYNGVQIAYMTGPGVTGIKTILEKVYIEEKDLINRMMIALALARFENKLDEAKIDELLKEFETNPTLLSQLRPEPLGSLGPVGKQLLPKLKAMTIRQEQYRFYLTRVIETIELSQ